MTFCIGCIDWTAVGSIGTVAAVLLALFQNRVQKWWRRKDITISPINPRNITSIIEDDLWEFSIKIDQIKEILRDSKFALVKFRLYADSEWEHIPPTPFIWEKDRDIVHIFSIQEKHERKYFEIKLDGYPDIKKYFKNVPASLGVQIRADDFISDVWILNFIPDSSKLCGYELQLENPT